jgi:hypothetical protein
LQGEPKLELGEINFTFEEKAIDTADRRLLVTNLRNQQRIPGIPADLLKHRPITIRLVPDLTVGLHGSSSAADQLITLPRVDAFNWDEAQRFRVVRHELAHIALSTFFDFAPLPLWFNEGFAEWASGGLDCVGEARVRLDIVTRQRLRGAMPTLGAAAAERLRLDYDLYGTFFAFLEKRERQSLFDGSLFEAIRSQGMDAGFRQVFGLDVQELEVRWQMDLWNRYGKIPRDFSCDKMPPATVSGEP